MPLPTGAAAPNNLNDVIASMVLACDISGPAGDLPAVHSQYVATGKLPVGCRFTGSRTSTETILQIFDDHAALGDAAATQPAQDRLLSLGQSLFGGGPGYYSQAILTGNSNFNHDEPT